jgi:phage head maturation protease
VPDKALQHVQLKNTDRGEFSALFSSFNCVDSDGDVTLPGAFEDGAKAIVSSYGHQSWAGALPVGKGCIRQTSSEAIFDGHFFMDTTHGRDTFHVVKALGGSQEWSFGFDIVDAEDGQHAGRRVRYLKRLKVFEVSPVLRGAGVGTRTLAVKSAPVDTPEDVVAQEFARFVDWGLAQDIAAELRAIRDRHELDDEMRRIRAIHFGGQYGY